MRRKKQYTMRDLVVVITELITAYESAMQDVQVLDPVLDALYWVWRCYEEKIKEDNK